MPGTRPQASSYFELPRRRHISADSSDNDSPLSTPVPPSKQRPPLPEEARSKSNTNQYKAQAKVDTIKEEQCSQEPSPPKPHSEAVTPGTATRPRKHERTISSISNSPPSSESSTRWQIGNVAASDNNSPLDSASGIDTLNFRSMAAWKRNISASLSLDRSSSTRDVSSSSTEPAGKSMQPRSSLPNTIQPLRPPMRPSSRHEGSFKHSVKVETSFTELNEQYQQTTTTTTTTTDTHIIGKQTTPEFIPRRSSINPLHIFSAPLAAMRRRSKSKSMSKNDKLYAAIPKRSLSISGRDPKTGLPKQAPLQRVTSLLQDLKAVRIAGRTLSHHSTNSSGGSKASPPHRDDGPRPFRLERSNTMTMVVGGESASSSLVRLKMGVQPTNTPEERATYRIKRSPSAESEEFLKIDISVRGETSYLPSEARRIHTPPLPDSGPSGRQRGFFFDYYPEPGDKLVETPGARRSRRSVGSRTSRVSTIGHQKASRKFKGGCKVKTGDWYGTQLAQLDVSAEDLNADDDNDWSPSRSHSSISSNDQNLL